MSDRRVLGCPTESSVAALIYPRGTKITSVLSVDEAGQRTVQMIRPQPKPDAHATSGGTAAWRAHARICHVA